ncbi:MAG: hypothetical protein BWZ10_02589 [candidate division BRC1 bacterium ADurb.BinA364]|nr:MAG: hypothetical protein BWZ10_02589 [candidate division BRC1 bacterium ADurb.BinA364]
MHLDHHLFLGHVQLGDQLPHVFQVRRRVGDDDRIVFVVGGDLAVGADEGPQRRVQVLGLDPVQHNHLGFQLDFGLADDRGAHDAQYAVFQRNIGQAIDLQHVFQHDAQPHVFQFDRDRAFHVVGIEQNVQLGLGRQRADERVQRRVLERDGDDLVVHAPAQAEILGPVHSALGRSGRGGQRLVFGRLRLIRRRRAGRRALHHADRRRRGGAGCGKRGRAAGCGFGDSGLHRSDRVGVRRREGDDDQAILIHHGVRSPAAHFDLEAHQPVGRRSGLDQAIGLEAGGAGDRRLDVASFQHRALELDNDGIVLPGRQGVEVRRRTVDAQRQLLLRFELRELDAQDAGFLGASRRRPCHEGRQRDSRDQYPPLHAVFLLSKEPSCSSISVSDRTATKGSSGGRRPSPAASVMGISRAACKPAGFGFIV